MRNSRFFALCGPSASLRALTARRPRALAQRHREDAMAQAGGKQTPANEVSPIEDDKVHLDDKGKGGALPSAGRTPKSAHFPGVVTPGGQLGESPTSVWDNWVATQKHKLNGGGNTSPLPSMKSRIASARGSARGGSTALVDPNRFNSKLATASGYTNTGPEATVNRKQALAAAAAAERAEIEDLKEILGRTLYTGGSNSYKRAGMTATATLQKLDDGQNDDFAILRARRVEEDTAASVKTGRDPWDSSVHQACPPSLKGVKPITPEVCAAAVAAPSHRGLWKRRLGIPWLYPGAPSPRLSPLSSPYPPSCVTTLSAFHRFPSRLAPLHSPALGTRRGCVRGGHERPRLQTD